MPATMLLLGGHGFLGSHLLAAAREDGLEVVPASRGGREDAPACDLLDSASIDACLKAVRPDLIVNAAGAASVGRSWEQPAEAFAINATGVLNLLEAVAGGAPAAHVLCISSADVYGARGGQELPLAEDLEPRPITPYGGSKAAMEVLCGQYARAHGLRIAIARPFNLIGPGQSAQFAVAGFARRVAEAERAGDAGVELTLGNPGAVRDFTDVRDGARALLELSQQGIEGTFNLCSGTGMTIAALVEELAGAARVPVSVRRDPSLARPADPPALVGDPGRLREATGFVPGIPLPRTLADLLEGWRAAGASA
ncbi:MAG TPA: NAD-dependent epimerase/dehydratase family protein [Solirubrobacterales bacterium]|nr:NAD-dependent epimerase/dehydratase family protein [Solirubrobacterales bacterium]